MVLLQYLAVAGLCQVEDGLPRPGQCREVAPRGAHQHPDALRVSDQHGRVEGMEAARVLRRARGRRRAALDQLLDDGRPLAEDGAGDRGLALGVRQERVVAEVEEQVDQVGLASLAGPVEGGPT